MPWVTSRLDYARAQATNARSQLRFILKRLVIGRIAAAPVGRSLAGSNEPQKAMLKRRRVVLIAAVVCAALLMLFFVTADYRVQAGVHYILRPPIASISWGPAERYIEQQGINVVWDDGTRWAGNFVEFPISGTTRVSVRLFSVRWSREAVGGWVSEHPRIARWLGCNPSARRCPRCH